MNIRYIVYNRWTGKNYYITRWYLLARIVWVVKGDDFTADVIDQDMLDENNNLVLW